MMASSWRSSLGSSATYGSRTAARCQVVCTTAWLTEVSLMECAEASIYNSGPPLGSFSTSWAPLFGTRDRTEN